MSGQNNTIEPGDLIWHVRWNDVESVQVFDAGFAADIPNCRLIAKGPGWTRHDGSSVNPVPGAECEAWWYGLHSYSGPSDGWGWSTVQFYRVTTPAISSQEELSKGRVVDRFNPAPSQPPAPQPGWVATVTVEYIGTDAYNHQVAKVLPGSQHVAFHTPLDWQPPLPPPWEPEVGELVYWPGTGAVIVHAIKGQWAWVEGDNGPLTAPLCKLKPPKGGA